MTEKQFASLLLNLLGDHYDKENVSVDVEQNGSGDNWVSNRVELRGAYHEPQVFSLLVFKDVGAVVFHEETEHAQQ